MATTVGSFGALTDGSTVPAGSSQIVGGSSLLTTAVAGKVQQQGTDAATSQHLISCNSTTDTVRPELAFLKSGNATIGSFTIVANGENLGGIVWYADDGVDYGNTACAIEGLIVATPGADDTAGGIQFKCAPDGSSTLAEVARITSAVGLQLGVTGTKLGNLNLCGSTSGVVSLTVSAAAGTWTMTLPAAVGSAGQQLTDAGGNGVCSWAAAGSLSAFKNILGEVSDRAEAMLNKLLGVGVYDFQYREDAKMTTGDHATVYTGVLGDELPEVMHFGGQIFSPVSAFGAMLLALKGLAQRLERLECGAV